MNIADRMTLHESEFIYGLIYLCNYPPCPGTESLTRSDNCYRVE